MPVRLRQSGLPVVIRGLALAVLLAGTGAAAQEFDIGPTLDCLGRAVTWDERAVCIGTAAGVCMNSEMGGSTVGMGNCLNAELEFWDRRLNETYRMLRAKEQAADADLADLAGLPGEGGRADALRAMQRAWIAYRDTACAYERAQWGGGTGGGPAAVGCLMRMTGEQALYLERMQGDY